MKYAHNKPPKIDYLVAPHWGAWIEIVLLGIFSQNLVSHPTGVRGLK